jgi:hypothetical protein
MADDPRISFPLWVIGSSETSNETPQDLILGMLKATANDGENACIVSSDEGFAKSFLEGLPDKEDLTVKLVSAPQHLDLLLQFFEEKQGVKNVLIGQRGGEWAGATIAKVRFNIAMQG